MEPDGSLPLDVHGSVHHNTKRIEMTNKMRPCSRILLFQCFLIAQHVSSDTPLIIRSSKTVIAASGFTYVCGCRQLSLLSHDSGRQPQTYVKPEAAITVFELLMMSGVSLETCWAIKKHWNNKIYYTVSSCWSFLYDLHFQCYICFERLINGMLYTRIL